MATAVNFLIEATNRTYAWFGVLLSRGMSLDAQPLKVKKEAAEYADNPSLEELADVYITVIGSLVHKGWSVGQLAIAVDTKMAINEKRTWRQMPDGTNQHVES